MADRWYDRPMWDRGLSAKDAAIATAAIAGPPIILGGAIGYAEGRLSRGQPMARARSKQTAPRYRDGGRALSPRTKGSRLAKTINHLKAGGAVTLPGSGIVAVAKPEDIANLSKIQSRTQAAAKGTATKVANGTIQPYKARRTTAGQFATRGQRIASLGAKYLPGAIRAAGRISGAVTVGALGLATYNVLTGKHAADRAEAMKRDNDPGRLATSGIISTATGAMANRLASGIAVRTLTGVAARAAGPLGVAAIAGYGAYKGYADEGVKGAVRGAVSSLTFGLADKQMDKLLGPKQVDNIGPWLRPRIPGFSGGAYFNPTAAAADASPAARRPPARIEPQTIHPATYQRTYHTGVKAGVTETVRNARA